MAKPFENILQRLTPEAMQCHAEAVEIIKETLLPFEV
jgi:hypothetical protein